MSLESHVNLLLGASANRLAMVACCIGASMESTNASTSIQQSRWNMALEGKMVCVPGGYDQSINLESYAQI